MKTTVKEWRTPAGTLYNFHVDILEQTHVLIAGATRSGKSVILNGLIWTALYKAPCDVSLILCDPKRVELSEYAELPHVLRYAETLDDILAAIDYGAEIMDARFERMKAQHQRKSTEPPLYIIVDEYADLMLNCKPSQLKPMQHIAEQGGAANVHLILATQAPNRQVITANIAVNMTAKIALRCDRDIESRQIIGVKGAETLPLYGDCYYKKPGSLQHLTGIPCISDDELAERVRWWTDQAEPPKPRRWWQR